MTPEIRRFYAAPAPLIITKANVMSRVHRRVHMDYVGIKTYRGDGTLDGEIRFVGLFTSQAYVRSPREIPFLRHKAETVLKLSGYPAASHAGKALMNVLETFPRDELFQIEPAQLQEWGEGILDLETRPRVRVFARIDRFDRFVSLLVYVPRDRYTSGVRERIGALLAEAYKGRIAAFYPYFTDGPLVRVQFIVGRYEGVTPLVDVADLERGIAEILRTWDDRLADAIAASGPRAGLLLSKYRTAFSSGYAETFTAQRALEDITRIERLGSDLPVAIDFYREPDAPAHRFRAAIYRFGGPINLSERVPLLENMGFVAIDERSYHVHPAFADGTREVTLHDMVLETADGAPLELGDPRQAPGGGISCGLPWAGRQRQLQSSGRSRPAPIGVPRRRFGPTQPSCASSARRSARATSLTPCAGMRASRATCWSCFTCASIRRASWTSRRDRPPRSPSGNVSKGRWPQFRASMRTASCGSSSTSSVLRCARTSSSPARTASRRRPSPSSSTATR